MKIFRHRKPSLKTVLGITKAKKQIKKAAGITDLMKPIRAPGNLVRKVKRKTGYYPAKRILKGQVPTPLGCLVNLMLIVAVIVSVACVFRTLTEAVGGPM